jgi:hypothetical protein
VLDNIGIPQYVNLAFGDNATISSADGEILVSLKPEHRGSTPAYMKTLREKLAASFPDLTFYFQPADIVSQILNFGLPAPIDIQIAGYTPQNYAIAREIEARIKQIPGTVDVGFHQVTNAPELRLAVDRTRAGAGLHRARRREQPAHFAQLEQPGDAKFLGRSEERHQLSCRGPDAAAPRRFSRCDASSSIAAM